MDSTFSFLTPEEVTEYEEYCRSLMEQGLFYQEIAACEALAKRISQSCFYVARFP
eukprot:NODE_4989_length_327_cov_419.931655_g4378_i0.p1 GENE.NODE_4989_length_327_cov_419.931655_g4378_i0~~NODE_4989_length_327_cov_419.931655_g4378_i0.p1  ORF type:complete len:55 (-),score=1.57 NODE_4989_length_327_cov_419.931655_g4378_i0:123-287(-)